MNINTHIETIENDLPKHRDDLVQVYINVAFLYETPFCIQLRKDYSTVYN